MTITAASIQSTYVDKFYTQAYVRSCLYDEGSENFPVPLVMKYLGGLVSSTRARELLHQSYRERNKTKAAKLRPLQVQCLDFENAQMQQRIIELLKNWRKQSLQTVVRIRGMCVLERDFQALAAHVEYQACDRTLTVVNGMLRKIREERMAGVTVTVATNENEIQAICFGQMNLNESLWNISYLLSSPANIRKMGTDPRIEGAATVLIEDAVVRSLESQERVQSPLTITRLVQLMPTKGSEGFYQHIRFKGHYWLELGGPELFHFMRLFGGRGINS